MPKTEQIEFFREFTVAEVKFQHGQGCSLGMPYGECTEHCGWKVVRILDKKQMEPYASTLK